MKTKRAVDLGNGDIGKTLFSLAVPAILAQLANLLYNMVDRIYIGKMADGQIAMAGLGISMPIIMLISAFSLLVGNGGAPIVAIKMGQKDKEGAEKIVGNSFVLLIIISIILTAVFMIFKEPILWQFGASKATIGYAKDYLMVYLTGTLFVQITLGMNPFINTQGFAKVGMISVVIGAVLNIIFDPIFIFVFHMGVKGAALASVISQFCAMLWVLRFLFGGQTKLRIRKKHLGLNRKVVISIVSLGVAPFIMHGSESLILISLNSQLFKFGGDLAVGAMTIMSSLTQMIVLPLLGLAQGAQPILGFNYGAKNLERIRKTFKILFISCLGYTILFVAMLMVVPEYIVRIFNGNPELVKTAATAIRIYFSGIFVFGAQIACQQTFLALGKAKQSMSLVILRKIILLIPLIFILPMILKNQYQAVLLAEPITDIVSTIITVVCFAVFYNKHLKKVEPVLVSELEG